MKIARVFPLTLCMSLLFMMPVPVHADEVMDAVSGLQHRWAEGNYKTPHS